jgi:hypothetical protein
VGVFRPREGAPLWDWLERIKVGWSGEEADDWFIYLREGGYDDLTGLVLTDSQNCLIA